jgi:two-component system, cell cycle sensor histidine kinase and response regulator CckA
MRFHSAVLQSTDLLERGLAAAFESSAEAVVMTDEHGVVRFCNPAVEELTGYSRSEILGKRLNILGACSDSGEPGPDDDRETILCTQVPAQKSASGTGLSSDWRRKMWQTLRGRESWAGEFVCRKKDGTSYSVAVKLTPIPGVKARTGGGRSGEALEGPANLRLGGRANDIGGIVASYRDVTVERRLQAQLSRSQGLEATGRMAVGIGHDFSNVLSVVNGCSEWLLSRMERDHLFYDRVCQIRQAGQRGAELTHQLLTLSKGKTGAVRAINVNQQIRQASSTFQHLAGVDVKFRLELHPEAGSIGGDPSQFLQIMLNLIANARDAMADGGTLTVQTGREMVAASHTYQGERKPGSYVTVAISDTGTGMGDLTKSRAFDPFFTTKDFGKGTGLGLSFVADVVRNSGGHIEVDTEVGRGTTFRLYLPELAAATPVVTSPVVAGAVQR